MSIEWISVTQRVPDDRREVLAWGIPCIAFRRGPRFLGSTKFNPSRRGGGFDMENVRGWLPPPSVTHWAEITGPDANTAPVLLDDPEAQAALIKERVFGLKRESAGGK